MGNHQVNQYMNYVSPSKEKREKKAESLLKEIMAENLPNLKRKMDIQVHEVQKFPHRINIEKTTYRHIIIKLSNAKNRERILKTESSKRKVTCYM